MANPFLEIIKALVDSTWVRFVRYTQNKTRDNYSQIEDLYKIIWERAARESADYVESNISGAYLFPRREMLWDLALSKASLRGVFAEFGVYSGESINYFASKIRTKDKVIFGFD